MVSIVVDFAGNAFTNVLERRNEPPIAAFIAGAIKAADRFVDQKAPSVMNKTEVAPSKDKHDYFAPARYYHPDGKGGLVRRDGVPNPDLGTEKYDNKEAGRFRNGLKAMTIAYRLTKSEKYANAVGKWLNVWFVDPATRMNPNMEYLQCIGDRGTPAGIISGKFLVDAAIASSTIPIDAGLKAKIRGWYADMTRWLTTSKLGIAESKAKNNHVTFYGFQVATYAIMADDEKLATRIVRHTVDEYLSEHFAHDGSQPLEIARTNSWNYTTYNLDGWVYLDHVGKLLGIDVAAAKASNGRTVRLGIDYAAPVVDGKPWPHPNLDPVKADRMRGVLRWAAQVYPDQKYKDWLAKIDVKTPTAESLGLWPD